MVQYAIPILNDGSSVVVNASAAGHMGFVGISAYGATKAAVASLVRHWAAEFSNRRIRFNSISPGLIDTPVLSKGSMSEDEVANFKEWAASKNPMGRIGTADEVANAVLFLASNQSSFVNAVDLVIDGGAKSIVL